MTDCKLRLYRVMIHRWDAYQVRVYAESEAEAEEKGLEIYQETEHYEHVDGGVDSTSAEIEEE